MPALREGRGSFRLFTEGDDLYRAMLAAIEGARSEIRMESFIFAADEVGRRFGAALAARARHGLDVRLHLDAFGCGAFEPWTLEREVKGAGVQLRWFHPWQGRHPLRYLQRNHRKLLVVDDRRAFLGGFNVRRENSRRICGEARRRDTHVGVRGELARGAAMLFDRLWEGAAPQDGDAIPEGTDGLDALLIPRDSRRCRQRLACLHAGLVAEARRSVYLTTPYYGPDTAVDAALQEAARRGVDTRLLVPRQSDPRFAGWATRSAYRALLEAGVQVWEYLARPLHAKTSVIDGEWAIIGSANLDHLSLAVNRELVLVARDPTLARSLEARYTEDLGNAARVLRSAWNRRGWRERGLEVAGRAARRLL